MGGWLKQSTAVTVKVGPFLDDTDFRTAETALTIQKADVRLAKNGGNYAAASADQGASDAGAPHDELGDYDISLDVTDTNTLGRLRAIIKETGALVVWDDWMVVPANVWDSLFGADKLQVHADEITAGLITAAAIADGAIDAATFAAGAINAAAIAADAITDAKVAADVTIASVTGAVGSVTGNVGGNVVGSVGSVAAGGIAAATFAAGAIDATAIAANAIGASELAADAVAEIADAVWDEAIAGHLGAGSTGEALDNAGAAGTPPTAAEVADAVWEEALADHSGTAGSTAEQLAAAGAAGDPWATAVPGAYGAGTAGKILGDNLNATVSSRATQASVDTIDDFLDTEVPAILADTNELQTDWVNGGRLDLLIDAIKAKTDALPTDPADASDIATSFAGVNTKLDTIDDFLDTEIVAILAAVDTEVAAIKAITDLLTLNGIADAILKRDFSAVTGEAARSTLNALRFLRNKWSIAGATLTVTKEDDATAAWTAALTTDAAAEPVTASDPA